MHEGWTTMEGIHLSSRMEFIGKKLKRWHDVKFGEWKFRLKNLNAELEKL